MKSEPAANSHHNLNAPETVVKAWHRAKARAKKNGVPFTLTRDDLDVLWERCEGRCSVSGLEFSDEMFPGIKVKFPYGPSIDQIEATKGYTLENARITCVAANFAMNQWGLETLRRVAEGVLRKQQEEVNGNRDWYHRQAIKLQEAERMALSLTGKALERQRHRIAGLKRAMALGPLKLSSAAAKANQTIRNLKAKANSAGR